MNESNDPIPTRGSTPAVLPYPDPEAGQTSGHSGTDTSAARAHREDADGTTQKRQMYVLNFLVARPGGVTVRELREMTGWHHGQASAALSNLHKAGLISRLSLTRVKCKVYVAPNCVLGRETEEHTSNKRRSETDLLATARMLRAALAGIQPDYCVTHYTFFLGCARCAAAKALRDTRSL